MTVISGRVVTPHGVIDGWVEIDEERIVRVGEGSPPAGASGNRRYTIAAGFIDLHVHGGGGYSFTAGDPNDIAPGVRFHVAHGTTTMLLSLVTAPVDDLLAAVRGIRTAPRR